MDDALKKGVDLWTDRQKLVGYLENKLIGPAKGIEEELLEKDIPHQLYLMGALFPQGSASNEEAEEEDKLVDDPVSMAYQLKPSSVGLSFFVDSVEEQPEVRIAIAGAEYNLLEKKWKRNPISTKEKPEVHTLSIGARSKIDGVLNGRAQLVSIWRSLETGYLVTVALVNVRVVNDKLNPEDVIHQTWFQCSVVNGCIGSYPSPNRFSWDEEEEDLALIYKNKKTFAIGHGCSASWPSIKNQSTTDYVETSYLPKYEVPPVTASFKKGHDLEDSQVFSLQYLANPSINWNEKKNKLNEFIENYEAWNTSQRDISIPSGLENASQRILNRQTEAIVRMKKGLDFLDKTQSAAHCFQTSNEAMLMQMIHSSDTHGGILKEANDFELISVDYFSTENMKYRWRPFQLAFQLLAIESVGNRNSSDRSIADLIWFPTGGGKTEAYLAITAFELFHRRLKFGDAGGGTSVILRYTLRLLTTQQFQRAAALICSCEYIRKKSTNDWGDEPFSLGLWVGQSTTPNNYDCDSMQSLGAFQLYKKLREDAKPENPFQLLQCPWCGTRIIPGKYHSSAEIYGIKASATSFEFYCPTLSCEFHQGLPIQVVDQGLYSTPPSFLIGTIDKFARLSWIDEPKVFFSGGPQKRMPPSLILQDELHLISGPLGTIAGVYEAAIDVVMQENNSNPKYIAATATIRRAEEQVKKLYSRQCMIFPPSGITAEDSYFSREEDVNHTQPGRLYIGVMGQYHTPVTSFVHTSAALAQSVLDLELSDEAKDGYWTQVIFHNSRRELGKTMTMSLDDIPKRTEVIAKNYQNSRKIKPVEMSANIPSKEIPEILEELKASFKQPQCIDFLPCTNMFSVGVDVGRLGLIVMNGQPKSTSEYIQASSRVGRARVPGLVVAFYPNNKARDRSQYESFISYHQSLYRAVEPTSVTPYARPSMERSLHAALIIVMRYCGSLSGNSGAKEFSVDNEKVKDLLTKLRQRMINTESNDIQAQKNINNYLNSCVDAWDEKARKSRAGAFELRYESRESNNFESLMVEYSPGASLKPEIPWATLNSMRNIDGECNVYVWGEESK